MDTQKYTVKKFTRKNLAEAGKIIISNRLYVNTWTMRDIANSYKAGAQTVEGFYHSHRNDVVFISYDEAGTPIGASIFNYGIVNVFVRKSHRRKGVGKFLAHKIKDHCNKVGETVESFSGIEGSQKFYKACGIKFEGSFQ